MFFLANVAKMFISAAMNVFRFPLAKDHFCNIETIYWQI